MPGFVRITMLIIKTQESTCLTGFFCCFFLPTTLATLPPNVFSEFGGDLFVSCSEVLWGYGHHFPAEKKALSALFTSPRCPGTSLDVSQAALEAHAASSLAQEAAPTVPSRCPLEPCFSCSQPINMSSCSGLRESAFP